MVTEDQKHSGSLMLPTICPHCSADLVDGTIPIEQRRVFYGSTHYTRAIQKMLGIWKCPDCQGCWYAPIETPKPSIIA